VAKTFVVNNYILIYKLFYKFVLIIEIMVDTNNFLVYKMVSNLANIVINYFGL